jgi:hypothetical protein
VPAQSSHAAKHMIHFLNRFGTVIFLTFMGVSVAFLYAIESVFNGGFDEAVAILWLPLAILIFGFTWKYRRNLESITQSRRKPWIVSCLLYPIAVLMSWPYIMAFNALTPRGENVIYSGPVIDKWVSEGRVTSFQIVIRDQVTREEITLSISEARYNELSKGDVFQERFSVGGLGIPFRWKSEKQPN